MTNGSNRGRTITAIVVWALGAIVLAQPAFAQSGSCKSAKGEWLDVLNTVGGTSGTVTNAGLLNGTTETVYDPAFVFTPDPNVVSYVAVTTVTTIQGQLVTNNVYLYDFATGLGTAMGKIDPVASTGRFAGATGVLYFNTQTLGVFPDVTYASTITGTICLASE